MPVAMRFLTWTLPATSIAALVLAALAAGIVVAGVPLWVQRWRLRARVRTLEVQVRQLETSLTERDRALLGRPASPGRSER
jgi:phosphoglycerate-specific signal transduction histidine kinase